MQADGYGVEGESKGGCGGNGGREEGSRVTITEAEGEKREDTNGSENQESLGLSIPCLIKKKLTKNEEICWDVKEAAQGGRCSGNDVKRCKANVKNGL